MYRIIPINRIKRWPLRPDMRPCKIPQDDFLALMAEQAPLQPLEPRRCEPPCYDDLQAAYNRGVRHALLWLAGVFLLALLIKG